MGFEHVVLEETSLGLTPAILSSRRDSKAPSPPLRRRASQTREGEVPPPPPRAHGSGKWGLEQGAPVARRARSHHHAGGSVTNMPVAP